MDSDGPRPGAHLCGPGAVAKEWAGPLQPGAAERPSRSRTMNSIRTVGGLSLAALMTMGATAFTSSPAQAQIQIAMTGPPFGGSADGQIAKRSVERYADLLDFSAEQKDS